MGYIKMAGIGLHIRSPTPVQFCLPLRTSLSTSYFARRTFTKHLVPVRNQAGFAVSVVSEADILPKLPNKERPERNQEKARLRL